MDFNSRKMKNHPPSPVLVLKKIDFTVFSPSCFELGAHQGGFDGGKYIGQQKLNSMTLQGITAADPCPMYVYVKLEGRYLLTR